ncbi:integrase arm-type DNA-binding domain-containing protein [Methylorubrum extorquens]
MPAINKLTAKQIVTLPFGLHSDGGSIYRSGRPGGSLQWVMRDRFGGRQRELGLGGAGPHALTLAAARMAAEAIREGLDSRTEPAARRRSLRRQPSGLPANGSLLGADPGFRLHAD